MSEYDTDILTWSEHQAELLRRRAAGELVNEAELDWPHIAEEIEAVGQSQVDQIESWLFQMAVHLLKADGWPLSLSVPHWHAEPRGFRAQARRKYRPSMAKKIDLPGIYAAALQAMPDTIDGTPALPVPHVCPWTLEALFGDDL
jgi:hypothetical protein